MILIHYYGLSASEEMEDEEIWVGGMIEEI